MTNPSPFPPLPLIARRFDARSRDLEARRIRIHRELDAQLVLPEDVVTVGALDALVSLVVDSAPDGSEVYVAARLGPDLSPPDRSACRRAARPEAGATGEIVVRWQVCGEQGGSGPVTRIRPRPGDATRHAASRRAQRMTERCAAAGWSCELLPASRGRELIARVGVRTVGVPGRPGPG